VRFRSLGKTQEMRATNEAVVPWESSVGRRPGVLWGDAFSERWRGGPCLRSGRKGQYEGKARVFLKFNVENVNHT
jgi:hypothetical protein